LGISKPVLVCSPIPPESYVPAVKGGLTTSISDFGGLRLLREAAMEVGQVGRFHLEVDTGMGRAGLDWRRVEEWGIRLGSLLDRTLSWEGCFTHFHSADNDDDGPTVAQWERLQDTLKGLPSGVERVMVHACNSPGTLRRPDFAGDAVRTGIFLFGGVAGDGLPPPIPVASLRARILLLRAALPGTTVGYGATYAAEGEEMWATVGIGYGDGFPRLLGNRGSGLVGGRRVPIIGRISMDVTVVDVTDVPDVAVGDVVTLFGRDGDEEIRVEEVATQAQTINYEILTGLTPRVPRIWTDDGGY
jgi:alanine racemase